MDQNHHFQVVNEYDHSLYKKGTILGHDQFIIKNEATNIESVNKLTQITNDEEKLNVEESINKIKITNSRLTYVYNKNTGTFEFIESLGEVFIDNPLEFVIWRSPTDNDRKSKMIGLKLALIKLQHMYTILKLKSIQIN